LFTVLGDIQEHLGGGVLAHKTRCTYYKKLDIGVRLGARSRGITFVKFYKTKIRHKILCHRGNCSKIMSNSLFSKLKNENNNIAIPRHQILQSERNIECHLSLCPVDMLNLSLPI
jgi:hypothetical protein